MHGEVDPSQSAWRQLAERMLHDYDACTPSTLFAEDRRFTTSEAGELQAAVATLREERGEAVVGYKVGCHCAENQQMFGITHPVWGRLWSTEQHSSGVRLRKQDFANLAIEGEFAVILKHDLLERIVSWEPLVDAIERVIPVIELHNVVFRGTDPKGPELIANNAMHCGVVGGVGAPPPPAGSQTGLSIQLDGEVVDAWSNVTWPSEILQSVAWLQGALELVGLKLRRGQTILVGALGPPLPVANVTAIRVDSDLFGHVAATLV